MAHTVISAKYPPLVDPTRSTLAYGDRAIPRLNRELGDSTLLTRQRAVMSLCDYLHDPEHIAAALEEGIIESLRNLLTDDDVTIRQRSTECFYVFGGHAIGREALLDKEIILPLSMLFNDSEPIVRRNAHKAMEMISETAIGAQGIVEARLVSKLVEKLTVEQDEMKEYILDTLHFCMRINTKDALRSNAITVFRDHLSHGSAMIRAKAARDIMDLSVPLQGKDSAVSEETVPYLVRLLKDSNHEVRANAAGALMAITVTTKGKYTALKADAIEPLVELVSDNSSEVRVNALQALTCLAEAPEGRKVLLENIEKISACLDDSIPAVVKAASTTVKVVTRKP